MRISAFFGVGKIGFFEIYGVSARTRRVESVWTFCGQGELSQCEHFADKEERG